MTGGSREVKRDAGARTPGPPPRGGLRPGGCVRGEVREGWEDLLRRFDVLSVGPEACWRYGRLFRYLKGNGLLIGTNDLWIAATALAHGLSLVTRSEGHFRGVPEVRVTGPYFHSDAPRGGVGFGTMTPPRIPPGTGPAGPPDGLRSQKARRVIRRFLGSRIYRDLVQGKRDPWEVEDALADELMVRAASLRRAAESGAVDKAEVTALQEGAEVLGESLERRDAWVAMMRAALDQGRGP